MKIKGSGNQDDPKFQPSYDKNALIQVRNVDKYCMFYALELARKFHDREEIKRFNAGEPIYSNPKELKARRPFVNYQMNFNRQKENILQMLKEAGIPDNRSSYGVEDAMKVQECYDRKYPDTYRIVIMDNNPVAKPLWKAPFRNYRYQVAIIHDGNHYHGLKSVASYFFGPRVKYCIGK